MKKLLSILCVAVVYPALVPAVICGVLLQSAVADSSSGKHGHEQWAEYEKFASPGAEHKLLSPLVGKWEARSHYWMKPGTDPESSMAQVEREWILGGRFVQERYNDRSAAHPFEGIGMLGFDKIKGSFTSTWVDTMGTGISTSQGKWKAGEKEFHFLGKAPDAFQKREREYRSVMKIVSEDMTTFEMYSKAPDGREFLNLKIVYTRKS